MSNVTYKRTMMTLYRLRKCGDWSVQNVFLQLKIDTKFFTLIQFQTLSKNLQDKHVDQDSLEFGRNCASKTHARSNGRIDFD